MGHFSRDFAGFRAIPVNATQDTFESAFEGYICGYVIDCQ